MNVVGIIYIGIMLVCVIGAVVGFRFISKKTKKGTLLVVGAVLYALSLPPIPPVRELHLIIGILRISGFIGLILGVIDLWRKPKKPASLPSPIPSSSDPESLRHNANEVKVS